MGFHLSNALKYIARANYKGNREEDLRKAIWYIEREIGRKNYEDEADEFSNILLPIEDFDFKFTPCVRGIFVDEIKKMEEYDDEDYSQLYNANISEFTKTDGLPAVPRIQRTLRNAINKTVDRVKSMMSAYIRDFHLLFKRDESRLYRSGIIFGTDTSAEGRCIIREFINALGNGARADDSKIIFMQFWSKRNGVNFLPSDKNYDLYQLARKVTEEQALPHFHFVDIPKK